MAFGDQGVSIAVAGVDWGAVVQAEGLSVERQVEAPAQLDCRARVALANLATRRVRRRDTIVLTDVDTGDPIFGGYAREPAFERRPGGRLGDWHITATGWEERYDEVLLTQAEGIEIVALSTLSAQFTALVNLLAGEGFTVGTFAVTGDPIRSDLRFRSLTHAFGLISEATGAVLNTSPGQAVSMRTTPESSGITLAVSDVAPGADYAIDTQHYRNRQTVIGGAVVRVEEFAGDGAKSKFPFGGANTSVMPVGYFSASALAFAEGASGDLSVRWKEGRFGGRPYEMMLFARDGTDYSMYRADPTDPEPTLVATVPIRVRLAALAPDGRTIYAVENGTDNLYWIDVYNPSRTTGGYGVSKGSLGTGRWDDIVVHDGTLYGVRVDMSSMPPQARLYEINPDNAGLTEVAIDPALTFSGSAEENLLSHNGTLYLYHLVPTAYVAYTINVSNGSRTEVGRRTTTNRPRRFYFASGAQAYSYRPDQDAYYPLTPPLTEGDAIDLADPGTGDWTEVIGSADIDLEPFQVIGEASPRTSAFYWRSALQDATGIGSFVLLTATGLEVGRLAPDGTVTPIIAAEAAMVDGRYALLLQHVVSGQTWVFSLTGWDDTDGEFQTRDGGFNAYSQSTLDAIFARVDEDQAAITAGTQDADDDTFIAVMVDRDIDGVNLPQRQFTPGYQAVTAETVERVTVDDVEQAVGAPGDPWCFILAEQALQHMAMTRLTSGQTLAIRWKGRWIEEATSGQAPRVDAIASHPDVPEASTGEAIAQALISRHEDPTEALSLPIIDGRNLDLRDGQTVKLTLALQRAQDVNNPDADEDWLLDGVTYGFALPDRYLQSVRLLRHGHEASFADYYRARG